MQNLPELNAGPPEIEAGETLDVLAGDWRIFQLADGHRFTTDDLATAWLAARTRPDARALLDLGAGIGSVGLLTLWRMAPEATLVQVEAQELSHRLARKTVACNRLGGRVTSRLGDLRDPASVPEKAAFDLITGSPPYIPPGHGLLAKHPQRAYARIELRGDVFDYCRTAAGALAPEGAFCFCHAASDRRPEAAVAAAGLTLLRRIDLRFRRNQAPTIALFAAAWTGARAPDEVLDVRDEHGDFTPEWMAIRAELGAPLLRPRASKES